MVNKEISTDIVPLFPHSATIVYLGKYYKASVPIGNVFPLDATKNILQGQ